MASDVFSPASLLFHPVLAPHCFRERYGGNTSRDIPKSFHTKHLPFWDKRPFACQEFEAGSQKVFSSGDDVNIVNSLIHRNLLIYTVHLTGNPAFSPALSTFHVKYPVAYQTLRKPLSSGLAWLYVAAVT